MLFSLSAWVRSFGSGPDTRERWTSSLPINLKFVVLTTVKMSVVVFWVVMPCSLIGGYRCSSKTLVTIYKTAWCHSSEDYNVNLPVCLVFLVLSCLLVCKICFGSCYSPLIKTSKAHNINSGKKLKCLNYHNQFYT
jgi:hypothetical protein